MKSLLSYLIPAFGYWKGSGTVAQNNVLVVNNPRISTVSKVVVTPRADAGFISVVTIAGRATITTTAGAGIVVDYVIYN